MPGQEGGRTLGSNRMTYMDDTINGWLGVGTQLDTFAHLGIDYTFYNGNKAQDILQTTGVTKLGVDGVPPMITRETLLRPKRSRNCASRSPPGTCRRPTASTTRACPRRWRSRCSAATCRCTGCC